jgi:hypothetical protein
MYRLLLIAGSVAAANILLNALTSKAASESKSWVDVFTTSTFGLALLTGIVSLLLMTTLYYLGRQSTFGMANGVLLMGAMSIVGGTLVGYFIRGSTVHWSEWVLMLLILCFVGIRYAVGIGIVR